MKAGAAAVILKINGSRRNATHGRQSPGVSCQEFVQTLGWSTAGSAHSRRPNDPSRELMQWRPNCLHQTAISRRRILNRRGTPEGYIGFNGRGSTVAIARGRIYAPLRTDWVKNVGKPNIRRRAALAEAIHAKRSPETAGILTARLSPWEEEAGRSPRRHDLKIPD